MYVESQTPVLKQNFKTQHNKTQHKQTQHNKTQYNSCYRIWNLSKDIRFLTILDCFCNVIMRTVQCSSVHDFNDMHIILLTLLLMIPQKSVLHDKFISYLFVSRVKLMHALINTLRIYMCGPYASIAVS